MTRNRISLVVAALAGALLFGPGPAAAEQASTNVNVRSGPGTQYRVVDVLQRGQRADVVRRSGGWCEVEKAGPDGWVSCRYLVGGRGGGITIGGGSGRPDVGIQFSIPGFSFSIGDGRDRWPGRPGRPGRPDRGAQICFYEHVGYGGDSFCMRPGQSRSSLGRWNDTISSIRVRGRVEAQVCQHSNFRGRCTVVDRNVRNLGSRGNDIISSIRVR